ncbi:MAG: hypothetical protein LBU34_14915 [Planctomycetaceae bacterium]|nr:hypothetical protein [Planctomycetaceae bacterium]
MMTEIAVSMKPEMLYEDFFTGGLFREIKTDMVNFADFATLKNKKSGIDSVFCFLTP